MGALCKKVGPEIYNRSKSVILEGIKSNLERESLTESGKDDEAETENLVSKLSSSPSVGFLCRFSLSLLLL